MPVVVKQGTLSNGVILRIVNTAVAGQPPTYVLETVNGVDAMGVQRWVTPIQIAVADYIATLQAFGIIP